MKKFIFPLLIGILFSFGNPTENLEAKLLEVYSSEQTASILKNNSQKNYFEALIFKSFSIEKLGNKKLPADYYPILKELELTDKDGATIKITYTQLLDLIEKGDFNVMKLNMERNLNEPKSFRLGNTQNIFHLLSHNQINNIATQ